MRLDRVNNFNIDFKYDDGSNVGGIVCKYKPPIPVSLSQGNKSLHGYTIFQDKSKSDTKIKFSIAFETKTEEQINKFLKFRTNVDERFIFIDEFGIEFRGYLVGNLDIDTPIEGDIYYISLEMLCACSLDGWKGDASEL